MSELLATPAQGAPRRLAPSRRHRAGELLRSMGWPIRLSLALSLILLLAALSAQLIAPYDPNAQTLLARLRPPVPMERSLADHLLGTDELGRDILARSLYGLQLTLVIALIGSLISLVIGSALGLVAGYFRGRLGDVIMAIVDIQIAVPFTLIALLVVALFGNNLPVLIGVIGLNGWERYARVVRSEALTLREMPYVEAAIASGARRGRIIFLHVLPNLTSSIIVLWTLTFSEVMLLESTLSFLGLGVQPPTATLGSMVGLGRDYLASSPWIAGIPAFLLMLVSLLVLLVGDWLRDILDVKLK